MIQRVPCKLSLFLSSLTLCLTTFGSPPPSSFPDSSEIPSLYTVLGVTPTCTQDDLKRSYRRLSLLFHPDKASSSSLTPEQATLKFQQIGFSYSILKDEIKREKYDRTGSTQEGSGRDEGAKTEQEWRDYFKDLWQGEVTGESIEQFRKTYQGNAPFFHYISRGGNKGIDVSSEIVGSEEEKKDLFDAYNASKGDLEVILTSIMCSTNDDEERFIELINSGISSKELKATTKWKKQSKDVGAKEDRRKKANKEAKEAEEYAKELGIHDKLFGGGEKGGSGAKKGKGKAKGGDDDDEAALKALIQGNRDKRMNSLMDSLEAKYGESKKRGGGGGGENGGAGSKKQRKQKEEEPSEEEFARIQAELDAKRAKSSTGGKGRKSK